MHRSPNVCGNTSVFCGAVVYAAIPYHGALSWKMDDLLHKKEITLEHSNILENGVEGILTNMDKKLHLPEKLYVSGKFEVSFQKIELPMSQINQLPKTAEEYGFTL